MRTCGGSAPQEHSHPAGEKKMLDASATRSAGCGEACSTHWALHWTHPQHFPEMELAMR